MNRQVDEWQEFQPNDHLLKFHYDHSIIDFGTGKKHNRRHTHKEVFDNSNRHLSKKVIKCKPYKKGQLTLVLCEIQAIGKGWC